MERTEIWRRRSRSGGAKEFRGQRNARNLRRGIPPEGSWNVWPKKGFICPILTKVLPLGLRRRICNTLAGSGKNLYQFSLVPPGHTANQRLDLYINAVCAECNPQTRVQEGIKAGYVKSQRQHRESILQDGNPVMLLILCCQTTPASGTARTHDTGILSMKTMTFW